MSITINKNGRTFIVECIIFQDASFEISINDVTQEEEQVRLKRQLTQNIAHELKTPVSSIQGYLETIVNNDNISREKMNTFLERCYAQSNRLSRLLRDISVLTRMDEAANMIDMERVDISVLVGNIINEVALELEEKHITIVDSLKKGIQIKGNYSLLYSIFRNLMDNAIAYAGTNIQININCFREDENFYYFSFSDTGVGVPAEHLNRLFERFYRFGAGYRKKCRDYSWWQYLRQKQSKRWTGIRVYTGEREVIFLQCKHTYYFSVTTTTTGLSSSFIFFANSSNSFFLSGSKLSEQRFSFNIPMGK